MLPRNVAVGKPLMTSRTFERWRIMNAANMLNHVVFPSEHFLATWTFERGHFVSDQMIVEALEGGKGLIALLASMPILGIMRGGQVFSHPMKLEKLLRALWASEERGSLSVLPTHVLNQTSFHLYPANVTNYLFGPPNILFLTSAVGFVYLQRPLRS